MVLKKQNHCQKISCKLKHVKTAMVDLVILTLENSTKTLQYRDL